MRVLGIETSCDETSIAIYDGEQGLLAHTIYSQHLHSQYGGVVPELASRDHIRKILPLIKQTLAEAELVDTCCPKHPVGWTKERSDVSTISNPKNMQHLVHPTNYLKNHIDGIAYTAGPGLVGALLVGAAVARSLGWALNVPTVGVHHLEGHLLAVMLEEQRPTFPFLALLVSGGHTMLIEVAGLGEYKILGESVDDAAGEAFDKTAKLLGLGYPGGAALAALAEQGDPQRFSFPRPMTNRPGLDFSFSGLKTFALNTLHSNENNHQTRADIARAFQDAVVDTLAIKCRRALQQTALTRLVVAGGVGANQFLRKKLHALVEQMGASVYYPRPLFCTDNGAMIAYAGYQRLQAGQHDNLTIKATARWPIVAMNGNT